MSAFTFQRNNYACGLFAFRNAVQVYGISLSYKEAKRLVGTTKAGGTGISGLLRGARELGLRATEYRQANPAASWRWLVKWSVACPIILLVDGCLSDDNSHWVAATGRVADRVIVVDSSYPRLVRSENGVYVYDKDALLTRWKQRICYGIRIERV